MAIKEMREQGVKRGVWVCKSANDEGSYREEEGAYERADGILGVGISLWVLMSACMFLLYTIVMLDFFCFGFGRLEFNFFLTPPDIIVFVCDLYPPLNKLSSLHVFVCVISVAFTAWWLSVMARRSSRQPGGDRVRGGLLGHAVVADHCVETAPRVGILGSVVSLKGGWDAALVLGRSNKDKTDLVLF